MAGSLNRVTLIGNLGRDPEVRRLGDGKPVVTLNIATSDVWRDKASGERKERTEWHKVVIFNENACKVAEQYLKKGSTVCIEGVLRTRKWQDQSGADRWSTEVVIEAFRGEIILLGAGGAKPAPDQDAYGTTRTRDDGTRPREQGGFGGDMDDEIPF